MVADPHVAIPRGPGNHTPASFDGEDTINRHAKASHDSPSVRPRMLFEQRLELIETFTSYRGNRHLGNFLKPIVGKKEIDFLTQLVALGDACQIAA